VACTTAKIGEIPQRFIGSIELDDADENVIGSLWDDTIHRRRLPGDGALQPQAFIRAVQSAGYRGPWGVEILSDTFRKLPLTSMAERSFKATMAQFQLLE
jgi:sugar phosphate isomerase/epimerase